MRDASLAAPPSDAHAAAVEQTYRLLKLGVVALLVLSCATPVALNLVDPDLWGHVKYGQDWLADGQLHRTATHTYTAVGHPWINHENAAELLFASLYRSWGIYPMVVAKCLLGLAILTTMVWAARQRGVHLLTAWAWMLLISLNLQSFFPMRPQLLSFAWCTVLLVCFERAFAEWSTRRVVRWKWLWVVPLVFVGWTNSHGGFVAGVCIAGAIIAGRIGEILLAADAPPKQRWSIAGRLAAVGLACLAATLVNPYGLELHQWLIHSLGEPRPEITEWAPPTPGKPVFWPLVALIGFSGCSLLFTKQRRDWPQILVLALVAWQACEHLRHIAFLALLCGFWLPVHVKSTLGRLKPTDGRAMTSILPPVWFRVALGAMLLAGIALQSMALADRLANFPVYRRQYPVDAIQYMVDHRLQGRVVVCFNWAQYAIAALAPHSTVQFDGRFRTCYPRVVADMHFDFLAGEHGGLRNRDPDSGPIDPYRVLEYGDPELVLLDRKYEMARSVMEEQAAADPPRWVRLYRDRIAEVWGRADRFDDPSQPDYVPPEARVSDRSPRTGAFHWPALPDYSLWEEEAAASPPAPAQSTIPPTSVSSAS